MRVSLLMVIATVAIATCGPGRADDATATVAVAPQYGSTHVYVAPEEVDRFAGELPRDFWRSKHQAGDCHGDADAKQRHIPASSRLRSERCRSSASRTPIPYPFGSERTGYLVTESIPRSKRLAPWRRRIGRTFRDPIGRDAVIQWPGGVNMQIYWHSPNPRTSRSRPRRRTGSTSRRTAPTASSVAFKKSPRKGRL